MEVLLRNTPLAAAFIGFMAAQILKILFILVMEKKLDLHMALSTGGMPSSHTSTVTALTTSIGMIHGVYSTFFAVSLVFSIVVIYDAVGIRQAAGKHAEVLNEMTQLINEIFEHGFKHNDLKTLLGHTYPQVLAGIMVGAAAGASVTAYL